MLTNMVLQISFVAQPETVDFQVEVMGGQTLSGLIPSLKAWIIGFARESLISLYVMPEHWVYRLDPVSTPASPCCWSKFVRSDSSEDQSVHVLRDWCCY